MFLTQVMRNDAELLRAQNLKKYSIPSTSCFKNIKSAELKKDNEYSHSSECYDLLLAKVALNPSDCEITDNFIICECFFDAKYINYYPEMFINICQNFLTADLQLRKDFEVLLRIARDAQIQPNMQSNNLSMQITNNSLPQSLLDLPGYQGENDGEDEPVNDEYTQNTETVEITNPNNLGSNFTM